MFSQILAIRRMWIIEQLGTDLAFIDLLLIMVYWFIHGYSWFIVYLMGEVFIYVWGNSLDFNHL